jgi:hypothetical protein
MRHSPGCGASCSRRAREQPTLRRPLVTARGPRPIPVCPSRKRGEMERRLTHPFSNARSSRTAPRLSALHRGVIRVTSMSCLDSDIRVRVIGVGPRISWMWVVPKTLPRYLPIAGRASAAAKDPNIPVSQLLAGGRSTPGRSPDAARVPALRRPARGRRTSRAGDFSRHGRWSRWTESPIQPSSLLRHQDASRRRPSASRVPSR